MLLTHRLKSTQVVLVLAMLLLVHPPVAKAAPAVTFAKFGERAGQVRNPLGVAVDQSSGDVYIADQENRRVDRFDADGNFLMAWGAGVADGSSTTLQTCGPQASPPTPRCFSGLSGPLSRDPVAVAVDQASGDVYVAEGGSLRVSKFTPAGEFLLMFGKSVNKTPGTPTPNLCTAIDLEAGGTCGDGAKGSAVGEYFSSPGALVVDSGSHVWVGDGNRLIQFDSSGGYISEAALPGAIGQSGNAFVRDSGGDFLAVELGDNEQHEVTFPGFAKGDTYRLGNLPAGCSGSSTDPIGYPEEFDGRLVREALESKCGAGNIGSIGLNFGTEVRITWNGKFLNQNLGQLSCQPVTGTGSCSVSTLRQGKTGKVVRLEPSGSPVNTLTALEAVYTGAPFNLTLDAADNLYVGDALPPFRFKVFNPAGEQVSQFGAGQVVGQPAQGRNALAIGGSAKALYSVSSELSQVAQRFILPDLGPLPGDAHVEDLLPTKATLAAKLNPEGHAATYFFEYGTDSSYGKSTPVEALSGSGYEDEDVEAAIHHLIPDTTYHFRLVASNHCNKAEPAEECTVEGDDTTFRTPPAVEVESQFATDVTDNSTTFRAELDPLGAPAIWWLEYGTDTGYGSATDEEVLGSGFGAVAVQAPIANLQPGTTYHYRFAARDERDGVVYIVKGPDRTVTTQLGSLGFQLADRRVWELVSPPDKLGASLVGPSLGLIQAAEDGEGIAYLSRGSSEADPEGNRSIEPSTILARREAGGWHSTDLTPPAEEVEPVSIGDFGEYQAFSPDLTLALLQQRPNTPLSPTASERTPYLRENAEPPIYTPLVTGKEGFANVPPGTKFGGIGGTSSVQIVGASPDLSHVALDSSVSLAAGVPSQALYTWSAGQLEPIGVLPGSEGGGLVSGGTFGSNEASVQHAISDDGSRIFWSTGGYTIAGNSLSGLYLRDVDAGQTGRLDVVQPGATGLGTARPVFQAASADGTVVFFTDSHELTEDASPGGRDLFRCEIPPGALPPGCATLTDVSSPGLGSNDAAEVLGISPAVSEDGSKAYFVAKGVLDAAPNQQGDSAVVGEPNLYVWQEGQGARFVAVLATADDAAWGMGGTLGIALAVGLNTASSPSGRYFAFMSQRSLTGYDNSDAVGGGPLQEVFLYDAATDLLNCVSCDPAGVRPTGDTPVEFGIVDPNRLWSESVISAALPQLRSRGSSQMFYRPRAVLDNGRVFFNAIDALVPADSNGGWDVYQREPIGVGDCAASSGDPDTSLSAGGCVSLLSSGSAEEEAGFLDADPTGDDAFFLSSAKLSAIDEDSELDLYDARVDGVPAIRPLNPECLGEACQPAPQAPNDPTPASAAFQGAGNVKPEAERPRCPKGKRAVRHKGKTRCVAKKRGHQRKQPKSKANGRAQA